MPEGFALYIRKVLHVKNNIFRDLKVMWQIILGHKMSNWDALWLNEMVTAKFSALSRNL